MKKEQKKISYNPFKMLGSWVGMIAYPVLLTLVNNYNFTHFHENIASSLGGIISKIFFSYSLSFNDAIGLEMIIYLALLFLFGFLLGWGIHSIIRWQKSKK